MVGLDFAPDGVRAIRMRKGAGITVVAADILDPIATTPSENSESVASLSLPPALKAKHAALVYQSQGAVMKLINLPGPFVDGSEGKLIRSLGLKNEADFRIGYKVLVEGYGKSESRAVVVAVPEKEVSAVVQVLATGLPVPYSIEVKELAAMSAFLHGTGTRHTEDCVGVIIFGEESSFFAMFNNNAPALIRHFSVGMKSFVEQIKRTLGVDRQTAVGIVSDGSFDISQSVGQLVEPLVKQLILSRDFVERRENCRLSRLYASGQLITSNDALEGIRTALSVDVMEWNPFEALAISEGALPGGIAGQEWTFAPAIGACLGTFEDT